MTTAYELDLADYWRIIKRRKVIVLMTFVLITSAIWLHSSRIPPTYQASGTIKIERTQTTATNDPTASANWESGDYIETQTQVINSREVALEAATMAGLVKEDMSEEETENAVAQFEGVVPSRRTSTNIVDLTATSSDPKQAALMVNRVAKGYQSWSLKDHNEQAHKVREYVNTLLKEIEEKLLAKADELKTFKEKTPIGASLGSFQTQLVDMELKLSNLLEKFTPKHPEVIELQSQINSLKTKLEKFPGLELQYNQLTKDYDNLQNIYAGLKQKYEDAKIAEAQTVSGVSILSTASVPTSPISPDVRKNTIIGALIALILGVLLAFIKENVDTSISTIEEVEDFLQLPILGVIPQMVQLQEGTQKWDWQHWLKLLPFKFFQRSGTSDTDSMEEVRKLVMLSGIEHQFSSIEAYKTLRTNVNFAIGQKKGQVIEITSSGAREGKSLTALNLSLSLAQNGQKTCLISADLRREMVGRIMGVNKEPGLVEVLTKDIPWQEALRKTTDFLVGELSPDRILQTLGVDNFYLMASGRLPPNPAELLSLEKFKNILQKLRQNFDFIIIDTPPVLPVSDASIVAPLVDGVILVYQVGQTARGALKRAKVQVSSTGVNMLGIVLNNIKAAEMKMAPTYYYYKEYYGPDEQLIREKRRSASQEKPWWQRTFTKTT